SAVLDQRGKSPVFDHCRRLSKGVIENRDLRLSEVRAGLRLRQGLRRPSDEEQNDCGQKTTEPGVSCHLVLLFPNESSESPRLRHALQRPAALGLSHPARAERRQDLVGTQPGAGVRAIRLLKVYASCLPRPGQMAEATGAKMCPKADPTKQQETAKRAEERFRRNLSNPSETSRFSSRSIGFREGLCGRGAGVRTPRKPAGSGTKSDDFGCMTPACISGRQRMPPRSRSRQGSR